MSADATTPPPVSTTSVGAAPLRLDAHDKVTAPPRIRPTGFPPTPSSARSCSPISHTPA
jgi:hypothetical protein